jgi:hypothetical protein
MRNVNANQFLSALVSNYHTRTLVLVLGQLWPRFLYIPTYTKHIQLQTSARFTPNRTST